MSYNKFGNLIEKKSSRADKSVARVETYFYDSDQKLVKQVGEVPGSSITAKQTTVFKYDGYGNKIEEKLTIFDGTVIINLITFKYDKLKRMIEMLRTVPLEKATEKRTYKYDDTNKTIEEVQSANSTSIKTIFKYDQPLKVISYQWKIPNSKSQAIDSTVSITTYDSHNNRISISDRNIENQDPAYERAYEYDNQNNWTMVFTVNVKKRQEKSSVDKSRTITYY